MLHFHVQAMTDLIAVAVHDEAVWATEERVLLDPSAKRGTVCPSTLDASLNAQRQATHVLVADAE